MNDLSKRECGNKKIILVCMLLLVVGPLFAQSTEWGALDSVGDKLIAFLSSKFLKSILGLGLAGEFGAMAVAGSKGETELVKKILPWAIGTGGMLGATAITNYIFKDINIDAIAAINDAISSLQHIS